MIYTSQFLNDVIANLKTQAKEITVDTVEQYYDFTSSIDDMFYEKAISTASCWTQDNLDYYYANTAYCIEKALFVYSTADLVAILKNEDFALLGRTGEEEHYLEVLSNDKKVFCQLMALSILKKRIEEEGIENEPTKEQLLAVLTNFNDRAYCYTRFHEIYGFIDEKFFEVANNA